jgi:hypothetical protein
MCDFTSRVKDAIIKDNYAKAILTNGISKLYINNYDLLTTA